MMRADRLRCPREQAHIIQLLKSATSCCSPPQVVLRGARRACLTSAPVNLKKRRFATEADAMRQLLAACLCAALVVAASPESGQSFIVSDVQERSWEWRLPVGCDYSGFFVEMLGSLAELIRRTGSVALNVGACSDAMLASLGPEEERAVRKATAVHASSGSRVPDVLLQHSDPCTWEVFRQGQRPRLVIGRTMVEEPTLPYKSVRCTDRVDEVWVPTEWHREVLLAYRPPHRRPVRCAPCRPR
jgi:hypothetical protein